MIETSTIMFVAIIIIILMIGASVGFGIACIIRAAKDEPEKDDWNVLICMVKCSSRVSPTQLLHSRLLQIGKKEYLRLYERKNVAYSGNGEPIDDN